MAACPDASWTAAPTNTPSWWTNLCYKSSKPVGALRDCFEACSPGAPACLSSANETRHIIEMVPFSNSYGASGAHWLGERLLIDHNISSMACLDGVSRLSAHPHWRRLRAGDASPTASSAPAVREASSGLAWLAGLVPAPCIAYPVLRCAVGSKAKAAMLVRVVCLLARYSFPISMVWLH